MHSCSWNTISQLRSVTCHMGSHSVTCYPTQVNTPRLHPSETGRYSIYLPRRDGSLSWPSDLFVTYRDVVSTCRWSPIQVLTGPSVELNVLTTTLCRRRREIQTSRFVQTMKRRRPLIPVLADRCPVSSGTSPPHLSSLPALHYTCTHDYVLTSLFLWLQTGWLASTRTHCGLRSFSSYNQWRI